MIASPASSKLTSACQGAGAENEGEKQIREGMDGSVCCDFQAFAEPEFGPSAISLRY